ncbi:MAG TPA: molybdate ABC transporter substrate-binding protein [Marinobacter sp.]|nr:molybdate ABC transporter substrate-binding protein [Marinobacter sp.]
MGGFARCLLLTGLALVSHCAVAGSVTLAVAANFTDTTHTLVERFEAATGHTAVVSYGSTGKLYAQIRNGAPYDVFMAADARRPALLESDGTGVSGTRFTYARGTLVLWSPDQNAFGVPAEYLAQQPFSRLAIANPKTAPYGLAARQVLEHLDLWQALQPKLVRGGSIAQAFQFIASGNAAAGFVALAQVKAWPDQAGTLWQIPQSHYDPIEQQAILLARAADNVAARDWLAFLKSPDAIKIIQSDGYDTTD